jgi:hypothetical protein
MSRHAAFARIPTRTSWTRSWRGVLMALMIIGTTAACAQDLTPGTKPPPGPNGTCQNTTQPCPTCSTSKTAASGTPGASAPSTTPHQSLIDDKNESYYHDGYDRSAGRDPPAGCASCGSSRTDASTLGAGLMDLDLDRVHSYRCMTQHSSLGPGVFFRSYDISLDIARTPTGAWQVVVNDPSLLGPLVLGDAGGGLFKGLAWNNVRGLLFYSGPSGTGTVVADPSQAQSAVLTSFVGTQTVYDIFSPYATLPAPWISGDIGGSTSHGSYAYANGVFSITASGGDIWNGSDQHGYVYQAVTGDCTITAHVTAISTYRGLAADTTNPWAKAGVMIRAGLDASTPMATCFIAPGTCNFTCT